MKRFAGMAVLCLLSLFPFCETRAETREVWISVWTDATPGHAGIDARQREIVGWFRESPTLAWVRSNCEIAFYDDTHPAYASDAFQQAFPTLPVVIVQEYRPATERWRTLARWSGAEMPRTAAGMSHKLRFVLGAGPEVGFRGGRLFRRRQQNHECGPDGCRPVNPEPPPLKYEALEEIERQEQAAREAAERAAAAEQAAKEQAERDAAEKAAADKAAADEAAERAAIEQEVAEREAEEKERAEREADEKAEQERVEAQRSVGRIGLAAVGFVFLAGLLSLAAVAVGLFMGVKKGWK